MKNRKGNLLMTLGLVLIWRHWRWWATTSGMPAARSRSRMMR